MTRANNFGSACQELCLETIKLRDSGICCGNWTARRGEASTEKIILFGSAAQEEMGPDSDLDLLVIKSCRNRRETARRIRRRLIGLGIAKDIIVATPQDIERYKDTIGLIYRPALKEAKVLYAA